MNERISVMTDFGELIATPFAGGISVDINLPDGKSSGQLAFIEAAPVELQDDYPTPAHVFTYDGRDSEPVHRTDVHLDGEAMTLDPVKGASSITRRSPRSSSRQSPIPSNWVTVPQSRPARPPATVRAAPGSGSRGAAMDNRDAKRKRPITCLESGATYDSAYRAAKELGFADSRNIFRSIQRGTCTQGLHFYYADEPKPAPEFFIPPNRAPRPVVCLDTGETFESSFQAGRAFGITPGGVRTSASTGVERGGLHFYYGDEPKPAPEFFRERHSKTRPIVCLETGETFVGNPAAARPLHVSPTAISQAVRYGSPVNGLHFYHGDEPKPAPEFFKPAKVKGGKSPAAIAAAAKVAAGNSAPGTDYREHGIQRNRRAVQ